MNLTELIKSADSGDIAAMYNLFVYYDEHEQRAEAEKWLYKSADGGYIQAIYVAVAYTIFSAATYMLLEVHEEALKIYLKGWNYLSLLTRENGVPQEIIDKLSKENYYNKLSVGIASCLILTKKDELAYDFIKEHAFSDEQKVLLGIAILKTDKTDDYESAKTAVEMLKKITQNKDLELDDWILAYGYIYLVQGYLHYPPSISGCSSKNEATEKAYNLALEASKKEGHTGSIGKDMLGHFRKKFFGGYEYIE